MNNLGMESEEDDKDIFTQETLLEVFPNEYHLSAQCSVGLDKSYIVHLDLKEGSNVVAGLSNNSVSVYDSQSLVKKTTFKAHSQKLTGVKVSPQNANLIYTGSLDQTIKLWDLRESSTLKPVSTFTETTTGKMINGKRGKPLTAFDVNCSDMFLAAGTEQVMNDSFVLFWDVRNTNLLGGYWDTFGDDVNEVKFHPDNPDSLVTGGADSTINVFDISCSTEDDALLTSTAIDSTINNLAWFSHKGKSDHLAITTDDNQLSFWCVDDPGPKFSLTREDVSLGMRRKVSEWTYIVGCHYDEKTDQLFVLAGSSCPNRPCLRVLTSKKQKLKPFADFTDKSVRNTIVRAAIFDEKNDSFYTGSEEGFLCLWKPGKGDTKDSLHTSQTGKAKSALKQKKNANPY